MKALICGFLGACVALAGMSILGTDGGPVDLIRARKIQIVGNDGRAVISLKPTSVGDAGLISVACSPTREDVWGRILITGGLPTAGPRIVIMRRYLEGPWAGHCATAVGMRVDLARRGIIQMVSDDWSGSAFACEPGGGGLVSIADEPPADAGPLPSP